MQAKLATLPPQCTLGDAADAPGAWTGARPGTPTGCAAVRLAQTFTSGQREVSALRITLRPALGGSMDGPSARAQRQHVANVTRGLGEPTLRAGRLDQSRTRLSRCTSSGAST